MSTYSTQNDLLLTNLISFYKKDNNLHKMLKVVTGESKVSLRIVDWFATNFAKKHYTVYDISDPNQSSGTSACAGAGTTRFKVYTDYKLKLKAYSKKRFDPFCRWDRINIPYNSTSSVQTTIGQLNFFKWVIDNDVVQYIETHYDAIESDMNSRNSTSRKKEAVMDSSKTRKRREELSVSATKSVKTEEVEIVMKFS